MLLITKFNKMIRNKLVWAAFALMISVFFVLAGWGSRTAGSDRETGIEGRLYGEPVTTREFAMARLFEMGLRYDMPASEEGRTALRRQTWMRLAALRKATALGISVSDAEMAESLRQDPTFTVNGVFDKQSYLQMVQQQFRVPIDVFETYMREELILRRLMSVANTFVLTPPSEAYERLNALTDRFAISYGLVPPPDPETLPETTEAEAREYYEANREQFAVPDQVSVRYVAFPFSNYVDRITLSEMEVVDYYEVNQDRYTEPGTNGVDITAPLQDVRDEVEAALRKQKAGWLAKDAAADFVMALAPDRYGSAPELAAVASMQGLGIATSPLFSAMETVPGLAAGPDLNQAAFALEPNNPERYFSDAVLGEDAAYVLAASRQLEAHIPDFEEIREQVIPLAREAAAQRAGMERAAEICESVQNAVAAGTAFADAMQAENLSVITNATFSVYAEEQPEFPYAETLMLRTGELREGDVSDPLPVEDGALLVYVAAREPGDPAVAQALRPELLATIERYRAGTVFRKWAESILAEANLEDLTMADAPQPAPEAAEPDPGEAG